ncbi:hypothetical protein [Terriglobus albidus]|uniref:hypothetical protein n=1 Tax=Terriglobus albidus TaxID=1592106 RepID=UPI0021E064E6|nr:hypothetical protein [Terriglobus albidus]
MNTMTLLWTIWAFLFLSTTALMVYRGLLTRGEEDQIFLDENILGEEKRRQDDIQRRIQYLKPFVAFASGTTIALSAALLGIYVVNAIQVLRG